MLRPRAKASHRFRIQNDSTVAWTVKHISRSCNCVVAKLSCDVISAGGTEFADVEYTAGPESGDDKRSLTINFFEESAPAVVLTVLATIRAEMTFFPSELVLNGGPTSAVEANFELHNCSEFNWAGILATPSAGWLEASCLHISDARSGGSAATGEGDDLGSSSPTFLFPRQRWRVSVTADLKSLGFGYHSGEIRLSTRGTEQPEFTAVMPVQVHVSSQVAPIPAQFFFGAVAAETSVRRTIVLRFEREELTPESRDAIAVSDNLGGALSVVEMKRRGRYWHITAALKPPSGERELSGNVRIDFREGTLPSIEIPARASVLAARATARSKEVIGRD